MIILLDLNYTLVANSPPRGATPPPMAKRLQNETYRTWLIELIRSHSVILVTARPERWKQATLERIQAQTGWLPHEAYFAPPGWRYPPSIKRHFLLNCIIPNHPAGEPMIAIESNPRTRSMYSGLSIPSLIVNQLDPPPSDVT